VAKLVCDSEVRHAPLGEVVLAADLAAVRPDSKEDLLSRLG